MMLCEKRMKWKHVKTGDVYVILWLGVVEKNLKVMVAYRKPEEGSTIWLRPVNEFFDGRFVPTEIET